MSTVAEQLRESRENQKLTLHQVSEVTKIRTDHIRALEEGDFDVFPAPVYIRGFVRTYAMLLKLDVAKTLAGLDAELAQTKKFREPPPLTDQRRGALDFVTLQLSKVDPKKWLIGLGIVAVGAIVWVVIESTHKSKTTNSLQGVPPGVYQPTHSPGNTLPAPQPPSQRH
jgi:cytoskeleton protein RodZ